MYFFQSKSGIFSLEKNRLENTVSIIGAMII